ncbi:hypothetical protein C8J56DRAFT_890503 [Mycena floridula]|nr:hypothetical protein C8J56DRAFT_890503 [Mycena floridula]
MGKVVVVGEGKKETTGETNMHVLSVGTSGPARKDFVISDQSRPEADRNLQHLSCVGFRVDVSDRFPQSFPKINLASAIMGKSGRPARVIKLCKLYQQHKNASEARKQNRIRLLRQFYHGVPGPVSRKSALSSLSSFSSFSSNYITGDTNSDSDLDSDSFQSLFGVDLSTVCSIPSIDNTDASSVSDTDDSMPDLIAWDADDEDSDLDDDGDMSDEDGMDRWTRLRKWVIESIDTMYAQRYEEPREPLVHSDYFDQLGSSFAFL